MRILSSEKCDEISESLKYFDGYISDYCEDIKSAINLFNNDPIVQSFYASGGFGKGMESKLEEVRDAVQRYYDLISSDGGLIPTTKLIIAEQRENLNKTNNGGV